VLIHHGEIVLVQLRVSRVSPKLPKEIPLPTASLATTWLAHVTVAVGASLLEDKYYSSMFVLHVTAYLLSNLIN
jgi:hypothetical protein